MWLGPVAIFLLRVDKKAKYMVILYSNKKYKTTSGPMVEWMDWQEIKLESSVDLLSNKHIRHFLSPWQSL